MIGESSDRRVTAAALTAAAAILIVVLVYAFSAQLGEDVARMVIGVGDLLGAALCTALCFVLWRNFDRTEILSRVWLDLGIGLAMWTLAELIYGIYGLNQQDIPNPSLADAVWLPGFIPIFAAFWLRYKSLRVSLTRGQMAGLVVTFAALAGLSTVFVLLPSMRVAAATGQLGDVTLGVIYGVGDLLLAMAVGLTIVSLLGGQLSRSWMVIALGFLIQAVGDSMHYAGVAAGWYSGQMSINLFTAISDISYWAAYVVIAVGLYDQAVLQRAV